MRITIWLSIAVFVTTLFWPHLLSYSGLLYCVLYFFIFIYWPRWRYLIILPLTVVYFNSFTYTTLLGVSNEQLEANNIHSASLSKIFPLNKINTKQVNIFSNLTREKDNTITIQIKSLINSKNSGYFIAKVISINELFCFSCPLIEVRWFQPDLIVQAGQIHQFTARFKPLQGKGNPGGFDRQKWRYSQHIAYIVNIKEHIKTVSSSISLRATLYQKALFATAGLKHQGALLALIFADKSLMNAKDKEIIKKLGIAHLFAISGLHIGLLFAFSYAFFNLLIKFYFPINLLGWLTWRLSNSLGLFVCIGYGYISGFSLPTQRALLMLVLSLLVLCSKRKVSLFDLVGLCLWFILLIDPLAILSSSLWLSFTAIGSILIFIWALHRPSEKHSKPLSLWGIYNQRCFIFIKWLFLLQLLLTLFMLPIQLLQFSGVSSLSLLINLIAIPLFSWLIIPSTLLGALLLNVIESSGVFLLTISNNVLDFFLEHLKDLSIGYILLSNLAITLILSVLLLVGKLVFIKVIKIFFKFNKKHIAVCIFFLISFVTIRFFEKQWDSNNSWQVEVFDIGQGLAVLVKNGDQTLLYDTGPAFFPYYIAADVEVLPYLQMRGISQLDYLFVSHSDNDHAGGANSLLDSLLVSNVYSGEASIMNNRLPKQRIKKELYKQCLVGQRFYLGKLTVEVLSPVEVKNNNNNNSCVLRISDGTNSLLLTGDINKEVERELIYNNLNEKDGDKLAADILIAPHHGSKTSSSIEFIKKVNPQWVVFPVGYRNRWNFPNTTVVQRYLLHGVKQINTSKSGFIRFNVQNHHVEVKTYREDFAAYWYHHHPVF